MNYHNLTYPDMNNGDGLRVVLWLSGCSHNCYKCQNPQTHDPNSGILFDEMAKKELFRELNKDYISGLTLTGGDPLHEHNLDTVLNLVNKIRLLMPEKTIWLYTGYLINVTEQYNCDHSIIETTPRNNNELDWKREEIIRKCNVVVDGRYIDSLRNISKKWAGSDNQRCINIPQSLQQGKVVLYCD